MKYTLSEYITPTAEKLAAQMGVELVDCELVKENTGRFLRFYIDRPEGIDLDALETFHRAILPLMDNVDYDYMEVCSPGADRPLKKDKDFARAAGQTVELHLYKAQNGLKSFTGELVGLIDDQIVIIVGGEEMAFPRKTVSQVAPVIELDEEEIDRALDGVYDLDDDEAAGIDDEDEADEDDDDDEAIDDDDEDDDDIDDDDDEDDDIDDDDDDDEDGETVTFTTTTTTTTVTTTVTKTVRKSVVTGDPDEA